MSCPTCAILYMRPGVFRITNWIAESSDFSLWFWHLWSRSRTIFPDWHEELHDRPAFWCCSWAKSFRMDCPNPILQPKKEVWKDGCALEWLVGLNQKLLGRKPSSIALHFLAVKAVGLLSIRWECMHSVYIWVSVGWCPPPPPPPTYGTRPPLWCGWGWYAWLCMYINRAILLM